MNPTENPSAMMLLQRDLERLCKFFGRFDPVADPTSLALDLWERVVMNR